MLAQHYGDCVAVLGSNQPIGWSAAVDPHRTILRGSGLLSCALVHGNLLTTCSRVSKKNNPRRTVSCLNVRFRSSLALQQFLEHGCPDWHCAWYVSNNGRQPDPRLSALRKLFSLSRGGSLADAGL